MSSSYRSSSSNSRSYSSVTRSSSRQASDLEKRLGPRNESTTSGETTRRRRHTPEPCGNRRTQDTNSKYSKRDEFRSSDDQSDRRRRDEERHSCREGSISSRSRETYTTAGRRYATSRSVAAEVAEFNWIKNAAPLKKERLDRSGSPPMRSVVLKSSNSPMKRLNDGNSPMKRLNDGAPEEMETASPKKRIKNEQRQVDEEETQRRKIVIKRFNLRSGVSGADSCNDENRSPCRNDVRSQSMCENQPPKSFASTPKSERRLSRVNRVEEIVEQNSIAMERNLSNNWADIIEEQEEQTKELNKYIEKVSEKYSLDKEILFKSLENDPDTLRKRQKRIYFGKVTTEYKRYLLEVPRKKREIFHPKTPNKFRKCSRRKFDGLVKKWRKLLHVWDETPDLLPDYKNSMDNEDDYDKCENNTTDDFGGASNITESFIGYNIDDYDIVDSDEERLVIDVVNSDIV